MAYEQRGTIRRIYWRFNSGSEAIHSSDSGQVQGFTLVEILVSMGIVLLLLGVGAPAYQSYGRRIALEQAATDVETAIQEAHNLSLAPPVEAPPGTRYYGVSFHDTQTYIIQEIGGDTCKPPATDCVFATRSQYKLPAAIHFSGSEPAYLWFSITRQGEVLVPMGASLKLASDSLPSGKNTYSVTVNSITGQVTIEGQ